MVPAFGRSIFPEMRSGSGRTGLTGGENKNIDYEEC